MLEMGMYELSSKLLVSHLDPHLIALIILPYIIPLKGIWTIAPMGLV